MRECDILALAFLAGALSIVQVQVFSEDTPALQTGAWRARLDSPGGSLPFELVIALDHDELRAHIFDGPEAVQVPRVHREGTEWVFDFEHFDAILRATVDSDGS